ncbi:MAG: class I adenylate-forming enzyme family protein [Pseudomonadota bacterium]
MGIVQSLQAHQADRAAVRIGDLAVGYGRLVADVLAAASLLRASGVGPRIKVGIRAGQVTNGHSYANWVAHLASLHLGAAHVSVGEAAALGAAVQAGMIDVAIGSRGSLADIPPALRRIEFDCDPAAPRAASGDAPPAADEESSRINLTSGTTGKPKFLIWDAAMIAARVAQVGDGLPLGPDTILYPLLHIRTTAGFRYPLAVWNAGGCVLLPAQQDPRSRDEAALQASTLIAASPVQLGERLRMHPEQWADRSGRTIVVLGGRLPVAVRDTARSIACDTLLISYGSTETGSIALGDSALIDRHSGAVGFVRDGVTVEIVDAQKRAVAPGEPGLVRVRTPVMSQGYDGDVSSKPSSHFDDGCFIPGDFGRLFEDGLLAIEGRAGDTFNVGGWKVNAAELEAKLAFLPGVDDLVACVMPLAEGDLLTIAVVTADKVDLTQVAERIRSKLPKGRTFHLVRIRAIPRNAMGKIPRALIANRLTELYGASRKNLAKKSNV